MKSIVTAAVFLGTVALVASDAGAFSLRQAPQVALTAPSATPHEALLQPDAGSGDAAYKSTSKAILYSLLLPGLGQQYLGQTGRAKKFYMAEAAIWTSLIVFQVQGHIRREGYEDFAQQFAGVASTDLSDDFYGLLTQYNSWRDYEADIKSEGRVELFPRGTAEELEAYFVANRVADFEPWEWQSVDKRRAYQDRRAASKRAFRRGVYAIATGIANRVAAAFFALKSTREINNLSGDARPSVYIEFGAPSRFTYDDFRTGVSLVRQF